MTAEEREAMQAHAQRVAKAAPRATEDQLRAVKRAVRASGTRSVEHRASDA